MEKFNEISTLLSSIPTNLYHAIQSLKPSNTTRTFVSLGTISTKRASLNIINAIERIQMIIQGLKKSILLVDYERLNELMFTEKTRVKDEIEIIKNGIGEILRDLDEIENKLDDCL